MTLADSLALLLFVAVVAYGLLAGADFGGGIWDLAAGGGTAGAARRDHIARSIGPVWEANHVWLIFALVVLWTAFPPAFAAIGSTLWIPLSLVAIGVIARGAGFAFRKEVRQFGQRRAFGATFAFASLLTPFFLGTIVGAIASGRVPADGNGDVVGSWWSPTGVLGGVMAVGSCAFLAAVFLTADAHRRGASHLTDWFRRGAWMSGLATGAVALAGGLVLARDADSLYDGLSSGADLVVVPLSALAGLGTLAMLRSGRFATARLLAALAVATVLAGWGIAQYPDLLSDELTIEAAAGDRDTLVALWGAVIAGMLILVPSLAYLFSLLRRGELGAGEPPTAPTDTLR